MRDAIQFLNTKLSTNLEEGGSLSFTPLCVVFLDFEHDRFLDVGLVESWIIGLTSEVFIA